MIARNRSAIREYDPVVRDLPAGARRYLDRIGELVGLPVSVVSVGPDREQTIVV